MPIWILPSVIFYYHIISILTFVDLPESYPMISLSEHGNRNDAVP